MKALAFRFTLSEKSALVIAANGFQKNILTQNIKLWNCIH